MGFLNDVDGRLFAGGAGGFLFEIDRFALCLRINPPLRISGSSTLMDNWGNYCFAHITSQGVGNARHSQRANN
jgi:hypothetical protein